MLDTAVIEAFVDRRQAGRRLGERVRSLAVEDPVVLGLARGGVPVAYEVARALEAPLDVLVVRKIGAPANPEFGIGAIAEGDVRWRNCHAASSGRFAEPAQVRSRRAWPSAKARPDGSESIRSWRRPDGASSTRLR